MPDAKSDLRSSDLGAAGVNRLALLLYGVVQAALTTGIATLIGSWRLSATVSEFLANWSLSWALAWLTMLPAVIFASPAIRRAVELVLTAYLARRSRLRS
ncbi:MAG TPA: DUF2798 domain-containing protein [Hyphomicrobiaceae bacterium]|nr:DUF2798 domain-containing protein [Hyphomicrobiaceae bacterium]